MADCRKIQDFLRDAQEQQVQVIRHSRWGPRAGDHATGIAVDLQPKRELRESMRGVTATATRYVMDEIADWDSLPTPPKPPQFVSVEDAEDWMQQFVDHNVQNYPVGAHVVWDRKVMGTTTALGVWVPEREVEFVGKVVRWWKDSNGPGSRYQLLTLSWVYGEPELVWVLSHQIKGLAGG